MDTFTLPEFCNTTVINETNTEKNKHHGATLLFPVLMFLAGVLGNILALYVLHRNKSQSVFYTLVAGLAWTDLTGILLTSPVPVVEYVNNRVWVGGEMLCKFHGFCMICFGISTPLIVCAMAVERLFAVRFPFFHNQYCRTTCGRIALISLWAVVVLFGILPLFGFGRYVVQYPCTWCFLDFHSDDPIHSAYGYFYASVNLAVIIVMSSCNVYVIIILLRVRYIKKLTLKEHGNLEPLVFENTKIRRKHRKQKDVEKQMIVLMCVITTVFAICWAPLMIQVVYTLSTGQINYVMDLSAVRLASLNQTLDPWLYILLRKSFIRKLCGFVRRCCHVKSTKSNNCDEDRNMHANHLRCFRKQCHVANPQYQYHVQIHIPPSAECVVHYKRGSSKSKSKSKSDENKKQQQLPIDLPEIGQGQSNMEAQVNLIDNTSADACKQCGTVHSNTTSGNNGCYLSVAFIPHGIHSNESAASSFDSCLAAGEVFESRDSDDKHLESDVFITKSTDLSTDLPQQSSRQKLLSDLTPISTPNRFSLRKKRAKSYT